MTPGTGVPTFAALTVSGGTLDLNGFDQTVGGLTGQNANQGGAAGEITNTSATFANFLNEGTANQFDGFINGKINYYRSGGTTETFVQALGYTGSTNVFSGVTLRDSGTALNSGTVNINGATLTLDNTGLKAISQRLSNTATVNMNTGTLAVLGQAGLNDTTALGTVNLLQGSNVITGTATQLNAAAGSETLTIGNLVRSAGATVNFTGVNLGLSATAANGGLASATNINLTQVGTATPLLANGILGGAFTVNGTDFATLASTFNVNTVNASNVVALTGGATTAGFVVGQAVTGLSASSGIPAGATVTSVLNATTFTISAPATASATGATASVLTPGLSSAGVTALPAAFSPTITDLTQANIATNAKIAAATATNSGANPTLNSLNLTAATAITVTAGSTLTLTSGGLISNAVAAATSITGTATSALTSGSSELDVYNNGTGVLTLSLPITGAGVALVKSGPGAVTLAPLAANTYGGASGTPSSTRARSTSSAASALIGYPGQPGHQ